MWIFPRIKLFWHSSSMWDKPGWLSILWQFFCEGLSSFNSKGFYSYALLIFLNDFTSLRFLTFCLYYSPSSSSCTAFDAISSNTDEVPWINSSANVIVFGDFITHHKGWGAYSGGTNRPGGLCYNFSISK